MWDLSGCENRMRLERDVEKISAQWDFGFSGKSGEMPDLGPIFSPPKAGKRREVGGYAADFARSFGFARCFRPGTLSAKKNHLRSSECAAQLCFATDSVHRCVLFAPILGGFKGCTWGCTCGAELGSHGRRHATKVGSLNAHGSKWGGVSKESRVADRLPQSYRRFAPRKRRKKGQNGRFWPVFGPIFRVGKLRVRWGSNSFENGKGGVF